jgi:hypothetical protein
MPWSGLLPINIAHAYEIGTSELHLNQHRVGGHRADHGPKHAPGMISDEARSKSKMATAEALIGTANMRMPSHAKRRLTVTTPLLKS